MRAYEIRAITQRFRSEAARYLSVDERCWKKRLVQ